jgi:hypothetical protein
MDAVFLIFPCVLLLVFGLVVFVIVMAIAKNRRGEWPIRPQDLPRRDARPPRHHVQVHQAADGFWLHAPRASPGSLIHYRYWSSGTMRTGSVAVSHGPKGAFVYTGAAAAQIEVVDVLPPGQEPPADDDYSSDAGGTFESPDTRMRDAPGVPPPAAIPEPLTGPPPAY